MVPGLEAWHGKRREMTPCDRRYRTEDAVQPGTRTSKTHQFTWRSPVIYCHRSEQPSRRWIMFPPQTDIIVVRGAGEVGNRISLMGPMTVHININNTDNGTTPGRLSRNTWCATTQFVLRRVAKNQDRSSWRWAGRLARARRKRRQQKVYALMLVSITAIFASPGLDPWASFTSDSGGSVVVWVQRGSG